MILEALIERIVAAGHAKVGKERDIFASHMPATVVNGVLLKLPLTGVPIDNELPGYYRTGLQVIVRADKFSEGEPRANAISKSLPVRQAITLGDGRFLVRQLLATHQPITFPRQEGNGHEWSLSFSLAYVDLQEA